MGHPEGGVSDGARYCIRKFAEREKSGKNAYQLIDSPYGKISELVERVSIDNLSVPWTASFDKRIPNSKVEWYGQGKFPYSGAFETAEWVIPRGYRQQEGEARLVFIHGSDSREDSLGRDYAGLTMRLANWTGVPVLSFNYPTEPVAPWPQNIRNVFYYISYALRNGHESNGLASKLFLVGDSEGTLVAMQTALTAMDPMLLTTFGYGPALRNPSQWLGGVILSSPVLDVSCQTPSFAWNCYNETQDSGDPDTGNCTLTKTAMERRADCLWSYLTYHFGFPGLQLGNVDSSTTIAEWEARSDFFEQGIINPLRANFDGFPPLLLLAGVRDYYYSDSPRLAALHVKLMQTLKFFMPKASSTISSSTLMAVEVVPQCLKLLRHTQESGTLSAPERISLLFKNKQLCS